MIHNMTSVAKIIEIVGNSDKSWEDAAQVAVDEAKKTLHGIHGIEVTNMTATVDDRYRQDHSFSRRCENLFRIRALV